MCSTTMSPRKTPRRVRADSPHPITYYHHTGSTQPAVLWPVTPTVRHRSRSRQKVPGDMTCNSVEMREDRHKDSVCHMCTGEANKCIRHTHFSTQELRTFAICYTGKNTFMCPVCRVLEPVRFNEEASRRLVLTDSTLYGVWDQAKLPANTEHFEIEAIVGGRVRDLTRALKANYLYLPQRLEIIVVAGLNNIGEGQVPEKIVEEMQDMKEAVKQHSLTYGHSKPSYVAFATLLIPPKFCSLYIPENAPNLTEWVPGPRFINRYGDIEAVNKRIKEINLGDNLRYINLHLQGVKLFKSGTIQHKFDTLPGKERFWREEEVRRKLHLTMENRLKVVSNIMNCFKANSNC